jgi:hypothetical protein
MTSARPAEGNPRANNPHPPAAQSLPRQLPLLGSGCAATMTALEHKDLMVRTQMSDTIFLDAE